MGKRHVQIFALALTSIVSHSMIHPTSLTLLETLDGFAHLKRHGNFKVNGNFETEIREKYYIFSYLVGMLSFMIPAGILSNCWSNRKFLATGFAVSGVIYAIIPFLLRNPELTYICQWFLGACGAIVVPCTANLLSRWAPITSRSSMSAFVTTSSALGWILGLILSQNLYGWKGTDAIFYRFGIFNVGFGLLLMLVLYDSPFEHPSISFSEKSLYVGGEMRGSNPPALFKMLTSLSIWAIIISQAGAMWGTNIMTGIMKIYLENHRIGHYDTFTVMIIAISISLCIFGLLCGWISDSAIERGFKTVRMRKLFNTIGCWGPAILLCTTVLFPKISSLVTVLIISLILGAGNHCGSAIGAIDLNPRYAGSLASVIVLLSTIIGIVIPIPGTVILLHQHTTLQHVIYSTAGVLLVSNLVYITLARIPDQPQNDSRSRNHETVPVSITQMSHP